VGTNDELNEELGKNAKFIVGLQQAMWQHQLESAPTFSLFRAHELQSDVCLNLFTFLRGQQLSRDQWSETWETATKFDNM